MTNTLSMRVGSVALACTSSFSAARSEDRVVTIPAAQDTTIFAEGDLSNGAGTGAFTGTNGDGYARRALYRFDAALAIEHGSCVREVSLRLFLSQGTSAPTSCALHRLNESWGEGASNSDGSGGGGGGGGGAPAEPGDASWTHRVVPTQQWATSGGSFHAPASASAIVGTDGSFYHWSSTPDLVRDVQLWIDDPQSNHGWVVIGQEDLPFTAKRFVTHEYTVPELTPALTIRYDPAPADVNDDGVVDHLDLIAVLSAWGSQGAADVDGDGTIGLTDLLAILLRWT